MITTFEPPAAISREETIALSNAVLAMPSAPVDVREDIFRIPVLGLEWDMGLMVYEPKTIATGADGKQVGIFLLHGGSGDYKSMEKFALLFAEKFGFKVVTMTFPGRLNFDDPNRDWPGDTVHPDGSVRTPKWLRGETIGPDQYELVRDTGSRIKYGTRLLARAKPGTPFYYRMAAWPAAFEAGMIEACKRHFPSADFSIYVHGHSTGGPFVSLITQRVPNVAGAIAIENSVFGYIGEAKEFWAGGVGMIEGFERTAETEEYLKDQFNDLYIRTWRDLARYRGPEALGQEGPNALMRLPWLMEEILAAWEAAKPRPQFKAEYMVTHNVVASLEAAARVTAQRLGLSERETAALIAQYLGYPRELNGPGVKPVPPFLFALSKDSRDHSPRSYREVVLPMFAKMNPAPRTALTCFGAGVHVYSKPEPELPVGIAPAAAKFYRDAIAGGFFVTG
jgi:hypothetical protein